MSVKVIDCLLTIALISVLNLYWCEARKLFNITEDAISIGREMFREVEYANPQNTNLTVEAEAMLQLLQKFHYRYNSPRRPDYINSNLMNELQSYTLLEYLLKFCTTDSAASNLEYMAQVHRYEKESLLFPDPFYVDENVFNLTIHTTRELRIQNLYNMLFKEDPDTGNTIMNILTNEPAKWLCWSSSRQQILYNILNFIISEDAINYVITQYYYAACKVRSVVTPRRMLDDYVLSKLQNSRSTWTEKDVMKKMIKLEKEFIERNTKILEIFVQAMEGQSREAWSCGKNKYEYKDRDTQFSTKLENLFQMYVINEVDLNKDGTCKKECGDYDQTKQYGCYDGGICNRQRTCGGSLRDCGTQIDATMSICVNNDKNVTERYKFIKAGDKTYGTSAYCDDYVTAKSWPRGFYKCTYCTCTCEEMNNNGDRYFNLRPVQSDINSNYVITNAKFTKVNNVVHIQIEEGQLLDYGYINQTSTRWKEVDNYTVYDANVKEYDYHTITWNKRKVYLGDTDSPLNYVITGLRISSVADGIKLEVGSTPFNFTTGKLANTIEWSSHANFAYDWEELKFENKDEVITNSNGKYVQFRTNDVQIDAGQSTIPYIDTDNVVHLFRVPFSGAGLFTKNKKNEGSYLSMKFLTYNFPKSF